MSTSPRVIMPFLLFVLGKRTLTLRSIRISTLNPIFTIGCILRLPHDVHTEELNVLYNLLGKDPSQTIKKDLTTTQKWQWKIKRF